MSQTEVSILIILFLLFLCLGVIVLCLIFAVYCYSMRYEKVPHVDVKSNIDVKECKVNSMFSMENSEKNK